MKNKRRVFQTALQIAILLLIFLTGCGEKTPQNYNDSTQDSKEEAATGNLIIGYDITSEVYVDTYVPKELLAKSPEEAGYILKMNLADGEIASYEYVGPIVYGDYVSIEFVDCKTGKILAENRFSPYFPESIEMSTRAKPRESDVEEWIKHIYPEWEAGQGPEHSWGEADCKTPATCSICGAVQEGLACHIWSNRGCAICGETLEDEFSCHELDWKFNAENTCMMNAVCSRCGEEFSKETDWSYFRSSFISGNWKADYYFEEEEYMDLSSPVVMKVGEDGSIVLSAQGKEYDFSWTFDFGSGSSGEDDPYPDWFDLYYNVVDEAGMESDFSYHGRLDAEEIYFEIGEYELHFIR